MNQELNLVKKELKTEFVNAHANRYFSLLPLISVFILSAGLGATIKLLPCDFAVIGLSREISLLQKCKLRLFTLEPQSGFNPSLGLGHSGAL